MYNRLHGILIQINGPNMAKPPNCNVAVWENEISLWPGKDDTEVNSSLRLYPWIYVSLKRFRTVH